MRSIKHIGNNKQLIKTITNLYFIRFIQQQEWRRQRKQLQEEKSTTKALASMDFSALVTTEKCKQHQDHIFSIYKYNPNLLGDDKEEVIYLSYLLFFF